MIRSCGCGNIEIDWDTKASPLVARKCSCDYCVSSEAEYASDSGSVVNIQIKDKEKYRVVKHGHGTAEFRECINCGVIVVTSKIDRTNYCVVNIKALGFKGYEVDTIIKNYEGESTAQRLRRRKENWCKAHVIS